MLIVAGYSTVDPVERDSYVEAMQEMVGRCRSAPGCLDVAISADGFDPARVNVFERWESQQDLDAWRKVAKPPRTGTEMRDVQVEIYDVSGTRPPF